MPEVPSSGYLPWRVSGDASKATAIANYCFYQIAMGKWPPGSKLPTVRKLEKDWSINRLTILKAYGSLATRGLVSHKPNGSYIVAEHVSNRHFTRDRIELNSLYRQIRRKIKKETDLSPLGALRMLARIAEAELAEEPDVAFVECSRSQALGHALEITEKLHVPVLPLVLHELRGKKTRIPSSVRVVLTTHFHVDELADLKKAGKEVASLPIEISRELLAELTSQKKKVVFLESDQALAQRTKKDAIWMMGIKNPHVEVAPVMDEYLAAYLETHKGPSPDTLFLVSQKDWEGLAAKWRAYAFIRPITCTLNEDAWPIIGEVLKVPFGSSF